MSTGLFPGVKRPGRGVNHPPQSSAHVKKEYSYTCTPLCAFMAGYVVKFTVYTNNMCMLLSVVFCGTVCCLERSVLFLLQFV
jgi:hypothetical protein